MMKSITITINTENAAFKPYPEREICRILEELIDSVKEGRVSDSNWFLTLRDHNNNRVGIVEVSE